MARIGKQSESLMHWRLPMWKLGPLLRLIGGRVLHGRPELYLQPDSGLVCLPGADLSHRDRPCPSREQRGVRCYQRVAQVFEVRHLTEGALHAAVHKAHGVIKFQEVLGLNFELEAPRLVGESLLRTAQYCHPSRFQ